MSNFRKYSAQAAFLGASLLAAQPLAAQAQEVNTQDLLNQIQQYSDEGSQSLDQGIGAAQFSDVSPNDWAFQALDDLVRRYDCLKGYPDGSFRGGRALSRYEFAAGLNACLQQIERLIAETTADFVTRDDLETLRRLMEDFEAELAALGARVDNLEGRVAFLEDNQFSTTTKLAGEVLFNLQGAFYGDTFDSSTDGNFTTGVVGQDPDPNDELTFSGRVRLNLNTSFDGEDLLRTRLQFRNFDDFAIADTLRTYDARLGYRGATDNNTDVEVSQLFYRRSLTDELTAQLWVTGAGRDDIISPLSPFNSSGGGAISRFGQRNPLTHRGAGENAALGFAYELSDDFMIELGYMAGEPNDPAFGIFSGAYAIPVQLTFDNGDFAVAASYVHAFSRQDGLDHDTGSWASNVDVNSPTVNNAFGLEGLFNVSDSFFVGAWAGYADATVIGRGNADVWTYALNLGFPDLGGDGNLLGFVFGRQPYLADADNQLVNGTFGNAVTGLDLGGANGNGDPDVGWHLEGFYKIRLTKNIEVTPGIIFLTAPNNNDNNDSILIGAIRTRFRF